MLPLNPQRTLTRPGISSVRTCSTRMSNTFTPFSSLHGMFGTSGLMIGTIPEPNSYGGTGAAGDAGGCAGCDCGRTCCAYAVCAEAAPAMEATPRRNERLLDCMRTSNEKTEGWNARARRADRAPHLNAFRGLRVQTSADALRFAGRLCWRT